MIGALAFFLGAILVIATLISAVRTFVAARGLTDLLTAIVFRGMRYLFALRLQGTNGYDRRDRVMSFYAPVSLLILPTVWLAIIAAGYTLMFWAASIRPLRIAFWTSGSSLLTLGFAPVHGLGQTILAFSEALFGLALVALLIAYLPTMYAAFARRETAVTMLETQAGTPPSPGELLIRLHRIGEMDHMSHLWRSWQLWFADVSESHTSLSPLVFYRSPRADRSWVTAAGAILDTAALVASTIDGPRDPEAELCIRTGYLCLRQIADLFGIQHPSDPHFPRNPISVSRVEYDAVCEQLAREGVPLKDDRDRTWQDFAGWRVNYDVVLLALAGLTMAPPAPWSSDRATEWRLPILPRHRKETL